MHKWQLCVTASEKQKAERDEENDKQAQRESEKDTPEDHEVLDHLFA